MQAKESRQCCVVDRKSTPYAISNVFTDERYSSNKARNYSSTSETPLSSRKNVSDERCCPPQQENYNTADSEHRSRKVRLKVQVTSHVKIDQNKDSRSSVCVEVTIEVSTVNVRPDVFNRCKRSLYVRRVVHC